MRIGAGLWVCGVALLWGACETPAVVPDKLPIEAAKGPEVPQAPPIQMLPEGGPEYADLKGRDPAEILATHLAGGNYFLSERSYVRTYLARFHPETPQGWFARGWLYDKGGETESARACYARCLDQAPELTICASNLLNLAKGDDAAIMALWKRASEAVQDVAVKEPNALRTAYFHLTDRAAAKSLLEAQEALHPQWYLFDFIRGIEAQVAGDHASALVLMDRALFEKQGAEAELYKRYIEETFEHGTDRSLSVEQRIGIPVGKALEHMARQQLDPLKAAQVIHTAASQLKGRIEAPREISSVFVASFQRYPSEEAVLEAVGLLVGYGDLDGALLRLLEEAAQRLPGRAAISRELGVYFMQTAWDPQRAQAAFDRALADCRTQEECEGVANFYLWSYAAPLDQDEAVAQRLSAHPAFAGRGLPGHVEVSRAMYGRRFEAALEALEAYRKTLKDFNLSWFKERRATLGALLDAEVRGREHQARNPFLGHWRQEMGESIKLSIPFKSGDAEVPESSMADLERVAQILKRPEAQDIIFAIEGHTDNVGNPARNEALSLKRAESTRRVLSGRFGVAPSQLRAVGYGPRYPLASNATAQGQGQNRRVEVIPVASLKEPRLAYTALLDASYFDLSPDGRTMALGSAPMELWDVERGVKVMDLGRGSWRRFSPDGRYLASVSNFTEVGGTAFHNLFIFDTRTGQVVHQMPFQFDLDGPRWDPFSKQVAVQDNIGTFTVVDVSSGARRAGRMGRQKISGESLWSADGRWFYTAQAQARQVLVWDARTLAFERALDGVDWVHGLGQTHDGRYLVATDNRHQISVWDTRTWERRTVDEPGIASRRIAAHPSKPIIAVQGRFKGEVRLYDVAAMRLLHLFEGAELRDEGIRDAVFNPDGSKLFLAYEDRVEIVEVPSYRVARTIRGVGLAPSASFKDDARGLLLVHDKAGVHAWDVATARRVHSWPFGPRSRMFEGRGPGRFVVWDAGRLVEIDTERFGRQVLPIAPGFDVQDVAVGKTRIVLGGVAKDELDGQNEVPDEGIVAAFELDTGKKLFSTTIKIVRASLRFGRIFRAGVRVALDEDRGQVATSTWWQDGFGHAIDDGKEIGLLELSSGKAGRTITTEAVKGLAFDAEGLVSARSGDYWLRYVPETGAWKRSDPVSVALAGGESLHFSAMRVERQDAQGQILRTAQTGRLIQAHQVFEARDLLVLIDLSGRMAFLGLKDFKERVSVIASAEGEWLVFTPEGYFAASMRGAERVYWAMGEDFLPFEALRKRYEDDRKVLQALGGAFDPQPNPTSAQVQAPILEGDVFRPPYRLVLHSTPPERIRQDSFALRYSIERLYDVDAPYEVRFMFNGRAERGGRPTSEAAEVRQAEERRFDLAEGLNVIQVSLRFRGIDVQTETLVTHRDAAQQRGRAPTARLWFFGVGVSQYLAEGQDLQFAARDVEALEQALKAQQGSLFAEVRARVLVNAQATARDIKLAMHEFLKQAAEEDVILIFIAGHGVQDNDQILYFMAHDSAIDKPYTGFEVAEFRRFLQNRPLRQKAVFWMDICHAGSLPASDVQRRGQVTAEDAIKLLSEGTGLSIMASSTGRESSLESARWGGGHGAFTAALLEGLRGAADQATGDRDGFNSVLELSTFVSRRVPELTDGAQHPTVPAMENVRDFPLSASRP